MVEPRQVKLDAVDVKILSELKKDGRITYQRLSQRVGLTPRPCLERVRKLEARGVICGYTAVLDPAVVGHHVIALAAIQMRGEAAGARARLEKVFRAAPAVAEVMVPSGEADYLVRVIAPDLEDYERLTADWLADPGLGIGRITTTFILKTVKNFPGYPAGSPVVS